MFTVMFFRYGPKEAAKREEVTANVSWTIIVILFFP